MYKVLERCVSWCRGVMVMGRSVKGLEEVYYLTGSVTVLREV